VSLPRESGSIKRAITLLAITAVLAASVLSSAPAQAATSTAGSESRTHGTTIASVAQSLTRAQLRAEVVATRPSMRPAEVEAVTDLLAGQATFASQVVPAVILGIVGRCALGSMSSVAIDELYSLVVQRKTALAESRIQSAIVGCLTAGLLPLPVRVFLRNVVLQKAAAAALVVAIRLRQICIPRCLVAMPQTLPGAVG
jgi:hypothetical protein